MARVVAMTALFLAAGAVAGCDKIAGKPDQAACSAAPVMVSPGAAAGASASERPAPVEQVQLNQRSVSTIVEQMSFQLCTARVNRWIDDEYYRKELTALRKASFSALGVITLDDPAPTAKSKQSDALPADDGEVVNGI